jgi:polar amino acid transport system permease protein
VIPHVFRLVYLPMVNQFVLLILGSSILSLIGLKELTFEARMLEAYTFRSFEIYLVAMFLYIGLTIITTYILRLAGWKVLRRRVTRSGR